VLGIGPGLIWRKQQAACLSIHETIVPWHMLTSSIWGTRANARPAARPHFRGVQRLSAFAALSSIHVWEWGWSFRCMLCMLAAATFVLGAP